MKILILGGTVFVGRHLVEAALRAGHAVTLFNRGRHGPDLYPELARLRGDRDGDLRALEGGRWDAVIDTCGYVPRVVRASANLLRERADHYTFISTASVYADSRSEIIDEDYPVAEPVTPETETVDGETYGPLKAACEREVLTAFPNAAFVPRPGLIVGPHDPTDRFTYWPDRMARGGEVLAPLPRDRIVQFIDARDLAEWIVRMAEQRSTGIFNATGYDPPVTLGQTLESCRMAAQSDARITWVDESFLIETEVGPWMELPLWVPSTPDMAGFYGLSIDRARQSGLRFRPLAETAGATLEWSARRAPGKRRAGLDAAREEELLRHWQGRPSAKDRA